MPQPIAIAVVEHAGRYLIGQRGPDVPLAGLWEFPGGKVEPGETAEQAAVRECREEADLQVVVVRPLDRVTHRYEHGEVELHFLLCRPIEASAAPVARFRWVPAAELTRYEFPAANAELVARLAKSGMG
ncbi:MAG TPA: (deoxy)nucleoside triphosphate pyrophosphohydrolase [Pirellulales bacterium]|nr:(deoxy)nucleoside triphosphate pyrophosphohydrolase [Pirellulales bacterium]